MSVEQMPPEETRYVTGPGRECFLEESWHRTDLEQVFRPAWNLVGHISQIPETGQFLKFALGDEEVVVVNTGSGLRAYNNFCRHRGHRLCLDDHGRFASKSRIVCPYHGWSYDAEDGACLTAVRMPEDFDRSGYGLHKAHVSEFRGLIYVCLADQAPTPITDTLREDPMGGYDLRRMKVAAVDVSTVAANWKVVVENNSECYHCTLNHEELSRRYDVWNTPLAQADWGSRYINDPDLEATFDWSSTGLGDAYRRNGVKDVCSIPLVHDSVEAAETHRLGWNPNGLMIIQRDYAWAWSVRPTGPEETTVFQWWLVNEDAREGEHYDRDDVMSFFKVTMDEDQSLTENVQRGIRMQRYTPGPLNPEYQGGGAGLFTWYMRRTGASPANGA